MESNSKKIIKDMLELWSSNKAQLEYQESVPIANVSAELFCQWSDDYYKPEQDFFKNSFTQEELGLLEEFNLLLNYISRNSVDNLPVISDFIQTDEWKILNSKARDVFEKIYG